MKATSRQRTKCFTGCWTCRSRRVKSDEESPRCRRCRQFGVKCEGYGVRLSWVQYVPREYEDGHNDDGGEEREQDAATVTNSRASRSALGMSVVPRLSSPELDVTLRQIDDWDFCESEGIERRGFSVFPVDLVGKAHEALPSPDTTEVEVFEEGDHISDGAYQPVDDFDRELEASPRTSGVDQAPILEQQASSNAILPVAQTLLSLGWEYEHNIVAVPPPPPHHHHHQQQQQQNQPPPRHLDALSMPSIQKRLIHHWVTFTSRKLVLLDEPHNPCRTMMLPMALKGLMSSSQGSSADVSIFHALCASSAYNLFELGGRTNEQDRALALTHDQQAIHHLRHNLVRADEHQDESFAMAIMACIAVEAISGTTQRWRTHVSGGLAYLAKLQARGLDDVVISPFRRHMLSMAILCDFPVPPDLKSFLIDGDDDGGGLGEGLEFTFPYYGVSKSFLQAHNRMNEYASTIATTSTKTPSLEKELDAFELQLYLDFPTGLPPPQDQIPQASSSDTHITTIIHHTSKTFYYASLIFFQRSIRRVPLTDIQSLVDLGINELESIMRVAKGDQLGCMMLWPVLVLGAECGTAGARRRMREWFRGQQRRLGFRNLVVLEELVGAVWRARGEGGVGRGGVDVDWREFIVQARFDVFRL